MIFGLAILGQLQDFVMSIFTVLDRHFFVHTSLRYYLLCLGFFELLNQFLHKQIETFTTLLLATRKKLYLYAISPKPLPTKLPLTTILN